MRKILLALTGLLLFLCWDAPAKVKTVSLHDQVLYEGELQKKVPAGPGTLYVMDRQSKVPGGVQDVITGIFADTSVSEAHAAFSSGWSFDGSLSYQIAQSPEKASLLLVTYRLTGTLSNPDKTFVVGVSDLPVIRKAERYGSLFEIDPLDFEASLQSPEGNAVPFLFSIRDNGKEWTGSKVQKINDFILFRGSEISLSPKGRGELQVGKDLSFSPKKNECDVLKGVFSGNSVSEAEISFSSGWSFTGDAEYEILKSSPDSLKIAYFLTGRLLDNRNSVTNLSHEKMVRNVARNSFSIEDIECEMLFRVPEKDASKYSVWTSSKTAVTRILISIKDSMNDWSNKLTYATDDPEYLYDNGYVVTVFENGFACQYPNSNYLEMRGDRVTGLVKSFTDGVMNINQDESRILYFNGDEYTGTFSVISIMDDPSRYNQEKLASLMRVNLFPIADTPLMFKDGIYKYANGKTENWKESITDYQQNKINGNYENVKKAVTAYVVEDMKARSAQEEKKWKDAMPQLIKEFKEADVRAIYEYRLNIGTNLELFKRLKALGLIDTFTGPMRVGGSPGQRYVIVVRNRATGQVQYSQVLNFLHPTIFSPEWVLASYSSDFI